jgi:AcrR family transcriptional regulator
MDKRKQRSQSKLESIKHAALELFSNHGLDKVSMDEIAAKARVSKVTIYKHFGTKEELYVAAVDVFIDRTLAAAEGILNREMDFLDKIKALLQLQTDAMPIISSGYLFEVWEKDKQFAHTMRESIQTKIQALMYRFYEEGRVKGYINANVSFESLYLYAEIFRAGIKAISDTGTVLLNEQSVKELYDLYFFGFIKRK